MKVQRIFIITTCVLTTIATIVFKYFTNDVQLSDIPTPSETPQLVSQDKRTRLLKFPDANISLIEVRERKSDGEYPSLYLSSVQEQIHIITASSITFESGDKSIASFGEVLMSPDAHYLFIEERGYEVGQTYTYDLRAKKLLTTNQLDISGQPLWSPEAICVVETAHFYGDEQLLTLKKQSDAGYMQTPSIIHTALGMEDIQVHWLTETPCKAIIEVSAQLFMEPMQKDFEQKVRKDFLLDEKQKAKILDKNPQGEYADSQEAILPEVTYF